MKQQLSKLDLEQMYDEMTVSEIVEKLNLSRAGLYKLLDEAGIPRKKPSIADRKKRTSYEIVE